MGLTYWSHRLSTWADLWTPDSNAQPQYDLAWRRFQARLTSDFISWQAGIVQELARLDQFVTTCIAYNRPAVDDRALTASLDVTAGGPYYDAGLPGLARPERRSAGMDDLGDLEHPPERRPDVLPPARNRSWSPRRTPAPSAGPR